MMMEFNIRFYLIKKLIVGICFRFIRKPRTKKVTVILEDEQ